MTPLFLLSLTIQLVDTIANDVFLVLIVSFFHHLTKFFYHIISAIIS